MLKHSQNVNFDIFIIFLLSLPTFFIIIFFSNIDSREKFDFKFISVAFLGVKKKIKLIIILSKGCVNR